MVAAAATTNAIEAAVAAASDAFDGVSAGQAPVGPIGHTAVS